MKEFGKQGAILTDGFKQNKVKLSALSPVTLMSWVWALPQEPKGASLSWLNLLLQAEADLLQWQGLWSAAKAPIGVSMGKVPREDRQ